MERRRTERKKRITAAGGERQWLPFKHRLRGGGHATARGTTGWKGDVDRDCGPRPSEKEFEASLKWLFFAFEGDGSHGRKGVSYSLTHSLTPLSFFHSCWSLSLSLSLSLRRCIRPSVCAR